MRTKEYLEPRDAFTLIELLVVIAIIGILGSISSYFIRAPRLKAEDVQAVASMRQIAALIEQEAVSDPSGNYVTVSAADDDGSWTALLGAFPSQAAQLPATGNGYAARSDATSYCLWKTSKLDDTKTIYCETGAKCSDREGVDTSSLPAGCAH
jgi:prepilin-type N-terminal cleavage/methylation domain-containing protein